MLIGCLPPRGTVVRLGLFLRQLVLDLKFLFDEGVRFPVGLRQLAERTKNTNRLLRQYLPRGSDLSLHSQPSSVPSQDSSMKGGERPCPIRRRLRSSQNVLQRSVELAAKSGHSPRSAFGPEPDVHSEMRRITPWAPRAMHGKLRGNSTVLPELPHGKSDGLRIGLACWFGDHAFVVQREISAAP
jgi:hypothetical protein